MLCDVILFEPIYHIVFLDIKVLWWWTFWSIEYRYPCEWFLHWSWFSGCGLWNKLENILYFFFEMRITIYPHTHSYVFVLDNLDHVNYFREVLTEYHMRILNFRTVFWNHSNYFSILYFCGSVASRWSPCEPHIPIFSGCEFFHSKYSFLEYKPEFFTVPIECEWCICTIFFPSFADQVLNELLSSYHNFYWLSEIIFDFFYPCTIFLNMFFPHFIYCLSWFYSVWTESIWR